MLDLWGSRLFLSVPFPKNSCFVGGIYFFKTEWPACMLFILYSYILGGFSFREAEWWTKSIPVTFIFINYLYYSSFWLATFTNHTFDSFVHQGEFIITCISRQILPFLSNFLWGGWQKAKMECSFYLLKVTTKKGHIFRMEVGIILLPHELLLASGDFMSL